MLQRLWRRINRRLLPPSAKLEGYENEELVDVVFRKTLSYRPEKNVWPDLAGASAVLDFGGACGAHYKEAILHVPDVRWAVVETPAMARRASELATDRLRFFSSIADAAAWLGNVDLMHSSGALQFAPDPAKTLADLVGLGAKRMQWWRLVLSGGELVSEIQTSFLTDNGPGPGGAAQEKRVEYPRTRFPEKAFLAAHQSRYRLVERGPDWFRFEHSSATI
jgi:putative methyltransferase (TIGR04325 family)